MSKVKRYFILVFAVILTASIFYSLPALVSAAGTITNDSVNKILTVACDNVTIKVDYNGKCKLTSIKVNGIETVHDDGVISSVEVPKGSTAVSTAALASSPNVSVNASTATISGISYSNSYIAISETWTIIANDNNIQLQVGRTYDWLNYIYDSVQMKMLGFTLKGGIFDTAFREDGGSLTLKSPADGVTRRQMAKYSRYGSENDISYIGGDIDLINNADNFTLSLAISSNREIASEIYLGPDEDGICLDHMLNSSDFTHQEFKPENSVSYHLGSRVYDSVVVSDLQEDSCTYTFSAQLNTDKYYDIGYIPSASGIDEEKFARFLSEFGRSSSIDLKGPGGAWNVLRLEYAGILEAQWAPDELLALQVVKDNAVCLEGLRHNVEKALAEQLPDGQLKGVAGGDQRSTYAWAVESEAAIPLCAAAYVNATGDSQWASVVRDGIRKSLDYRLSMDADDNGLLEADLASNYSEKHMQWLDQLRNGGEDAYMNALMYGALIEWAGIEELALGDPSKAQYYRNKAWNIKKQFNKDISQGGLWSNKHKGFIGWRYMDGAVMADCKSLYVDSAAIKYGLADEDRMNDILFGEFDGYNGIEDWMLRNDAKAYPLNLFALKAGQDIQPRYNFSYPEWENGQVFLHLTGEMMGAYARAGSTEAVKCMKNIIDLYYTQNDPMWFKDVYTWQLGTDTFGCDIRMSVNMQSAAAFITSVLGIKPKYDALTVNPVLDPSLFGTEINYSMRGHDFRIRYDSNTQRTLMQNDGALTVRFQWNNVVPGTVCTVTDNGNAVTRVADPNGIVSYDITASGQHTVSISGIVDKSDTAASGKAFQTSWTATLGYSSVQGDSNWSYQQWDGSSYIDMTWDGSKWIGDYMYCLINNHKMHPDVNDSVRKWVAPSHGMVGVKGIVSKETGNGDGIYARIKKNGTQLWNRLVTGTDGDAYDLTVDVRQGDCLYFIVNKNGTNSGDATIWNPNVTYLSYDSYRQFSSAQGGSNWYYQQWDGSSYTDMTWDAVSGRWVGNQTNCLIMSNKQHPDTNDSVRKWVAPKAGKIVVSGRVRKEAANGDGVKVKIKKNDSVIWGENLITGTSWTGYETAVDINENDAIYFIVNKNGSNNSDATYWDQYIYYDSSWEASNTASDGFSSTQGLSGWYYQQWDGSSYTDMTWDVANGRWKGNQTYCLVMSNKQHPDITASVRKWIAPQSGRIKITGNVRKETAGGDGVKVKIIRNGTTIWGESTIAPNDTTGIIHDIEVPVKAGESIYFIVDKNVTVTNDATIWDPKISYVFSSSDGFRQYQEEGNWYYQTWDGNKYEFMKWDSESSVWKDKMTNTIVWNWKTGCDKNTDSVKKWVAPSNGTITIEGSAVMINSGGDGTKIKIKKNDTTIWGEYILQGIGMSEGIDHCIQTSVNAGDTIYFIANKNINADGELDEIMWIPSIYYDTPFTTAATGFSSSQGNNGWYYQQWDGNSYTDMTWDSGTGRWKGTQTYCLVMNNRQHPDINDSVRKWVADADRTVKITGTVRKEAAGGDGVRVKIGKYNATTGTTITLWGEYYIDGNDTTGISHDITTVCKAGDTLYFSVDKNGTNSVDAVIWDPQLINVAGPSIYQEWNGSAYADMTWDAFYTWWEGSRENFCQVTDGSTQHPDIKDSVRKWIAPRSGTVSVKGTARMLNTGGDGVKVRILKNDAVVWGESNIAGNDTAGISHDFNIAVNSGDAVYFIVNKNGTNNNDTVEWSPSISYN